MAKRGRPTKYSEKLADEICRLVRTGISLRKASESCGVSYDVVRKWKENNPDFFTKCRKAEIFKETTAQESELKAIIEGNIIATQKYLTRLENLRNHREMEKLRREEINLKRNGSTMEVLPVVLDVQKVIDELEGNTGEVSEPAGD